LATLEIGGAKIHIEGHNLIFVNPSRFILLKKTLKCSDINSIESELLIIQGHGKGRGMEFPFTCLYAYLNDGKRVLLAKEAGDNSFRFQAVAQELQRQVVTDNMQARGIQNPHF
jgi:hypothetical protein